MNWSVWTGVGEDVKGEAAGSEVLVEIKGENRQTKASSSIFIYRLTLCALLSHRYSTMCMPGVLNRSPGTGVTDGSELPCGRGS